MSERTKLLKKAVLTGVGATTSVDRIKNALNDAMQDLVKVGHDLLDELEDRGKNRTENVQQFLKTLQEEAGRKTLDVEKKVSGNVKGGIKKTAKELGLVTREEYEELLERVNALEEENGTHEDSEGKKTRRRKASS